MAYKANRTETVDTPQRSDEGRLIPPGEAARRLGITPKTLRLWHAVGLLRARMTAGGQRRYWEAEVDALAARFDQAAA